MFYWVLVEILSLNADIIPRAISVIFIALQEVLEYRILFARSVNVLVPIGRTGLDTTQVSREKLWKQLSLNH